ncbi:MAG: sensor domain-containing phosphodiesterase [Alphaproteobacteria bacterium]
MSSKENSAQTNNELKRLNELYALEVLDTLPEERFDRYTRLAASVFNVSTVLISLVDSKRQWSKSFYGVHVPDTARDVSFCGAAIAEEEIFVVPDALEDDRFARNPLVTGASHIRFYAGAILKGPNGYPLGTLCLMDQFARDFHPKWRQCLVQFAKLVEHELHVNYLLKHTKEDLEKALFYNHLTDMPNRRLFTQRLAQRLDRRKENDEIIVFSLMIKRFHHIKNVFGQGIAYGIVNELNFRLRKTFDIDLNIAHDETGCFLLFVQVPSGFSKTPSFQEIIDSLLSTFRKPFHVVEESSLPGKKLEMLSGGLGISISPKDGDKADELIEKASVAMHSNQVTGITFKIYKEKFSNRIANYFDVKSRLRHALEHDHLDIAYQPIMNCQSGRICGVEALCRWNDHENGSISPIDFIPIAEESGLIVKLGEFMFRQACEHLQGWQKEGSPPIFVSVNIVREQLFRESFRLFVKQTLQQMQLDPSSFKLEITESSFIDNVDEAIKHMNEIIKMGVRFVVDDFGTGYSSLSYLRKLPVSTLKIDKSFISQLTQNNRDALLTHSIISLSKRLGLDVIAEGVETKEQLLFLQAYQCDQVQGYLFSKPLNEPDFRKFLAANHHISNEVNH